MLVTKRLLFKSLLLNAGPHNLKSSGEGIQSHHGPLVLFALRNDWRENVVELQNYVVY